MSFYFCNEACRPSNIIQGLIFEFKLLSLKAQKANAIKSSIYVFLKRKVGKEDTQGTYESWNPNDH